ncbi:MAG: YraN family protein [Candidatus Pacebacteria bacterium]|nr:YraN family protein [Candidatus Paceibacterota bacterium]
MEISQLSRKDIGTLGERVAAEYLRRHGFDIVDRNVCRKTGEIDVIAKKEGRLHFVEVKTLVCREFPTAKDVQDYYDPSQNLHANKIRKVARTSEWYMADINWEGESQIDGVVIWLREWDGLARVRYFPQIL